MNYNIISTGSHGNAVVVSGNILIDCGVSFKALQSIYKDIKLVLLTHEHTDHINKTTLTMLARERPTLRFGCCEWMVKHLIDCEIPHKNIDVYEIGRIYDYKAFKVSPVKLYHNVPNCGYRLFVDGERGIYATDTAHLNGITAKDYDLYLIEGNYTDDELQERIQQKLDAGQYSYELNVANRHLSREQATEWLLNNMGANSKYEFLHQHIERNTPNEENKI